MSNARAEMTWEEYCWIADAVGYDHASSVGAAYKKLVEFRETLSNSGGLLINAEDKKSLNSVEEYDDWVRSVFPGFSDDPLHTIFKKP